MSIHGFWYLQGLLEPIPQGYRGTTVFGLSVKTAFRGRNSIDLENKENAGLGVGLCGLRTCILCTVIGRIVQGFVPHRYSSAGATFSRISSLCIVHIRRGHEKNRERFGKQTQSSGQDALEVSLGSGCCWAHAPHCRPPWLIRGCNWAHTSSSACCSFPGCFLNKGLALKSSSQGWLLRKTNLKQPSLEGMMY